MNENEDWRETLAGGIAVIGFAEETAAREKLEVYIRELVKWNGVFGLVARPAGGTQSDPAREIVIRHILDSLAGLPHIRQMIASPAPEPALADVGSGAGLPGIPLAVFLPQTRITLIEPSQKRCAFLRSAAALMNLKNVRVFETQLAAVRETFDIVTCRAFRPLDKKILTALRAIAKPRGVIAAYKATEEKIRAETACARALGMNVHAQPLSVPHLTGERHLLIIQPEVKS